MSRSVLIVEDEATLAKNIQAYLRRHGFAATTAASGQQGLSLWATLRQDVVLLDYQLGDMNGLEVLQALRRNDSEQNVILMTGQGDVRLAVTAMQAGAVDYLTKPLVLEEVKLLLERLIDRQRKSHALAYYQRREAEYGDLGRLLGDSPVMQALRDRLAQFIDAERRLIDGETPPAVLITGETGTGKELAARAFHFGGERRDRPFVELNCAALPTQLMEAELFGFERGAFTDAKARKPGLAETADGGTLFLDEIGELEPALQAKLLRLLEDKSVRRLGGVRENPIDVRIIAATNQDLEQRVARGEFRADLLFRLRIVHVELPPLRERGDDALSLAASFLTHHARRYGKKNLRLSDRAKALLQRHRWPGNVRELRNTIEQAVLLIDGETVEPEHLPISGAAVVEYAPAKAAEAPEATETVAAVNDRPFNLEQLELDAITRALTETRWNVTRAAQLVGLSRDALRYRLEKHGLKPPPG